MEYTISLDPVYFRFRFSDRIKEIGNSVHYCRMKDEPEPVLFTVTCSSGTPADRIAEMVKEASSGTDYLPFLADGFVKRGGRRSGLSIKVKESPEIVIFCRRFEELLLSEGLSFMNRLDEKSGLVIPVMDYPGFLDSEIIWRHANSNISGIVMEIASKIWRRPEYRIRNFRLAAGTFRIRIEDNDGNVLVYDLVAGGIANPDDKVAFGDSLRKFRISRGYQSERSMHTAEEDIFFTSDMHFDHHPIILGAARPFVKGDFREMNEVLTRNWNSIVKPSDRVYFLGDLTYNLDGETASNFLCRLNGEVSFIRGNHDRDIEDSSDSATFSDNGREFYLVHDPAKKPEDFDGWIIHGHTHNSRMNDYPFINFRNKTINVSCELTRYHPVSIRDIGKILDLYEEGTIKNEEILLYEDILPLIFERSVI